MVSLFTYKNLDKDAYAKMLALIAMADGILKEEEFELWEAKLGQILVHPTVRNKYRKYIKMHFAIEDVLDGVDTRTILYALRDALLMARIDGELHESELERLMQMADAANITRERMKKFDDWAKEGIDWMQRGDMLTTISLPKSDDIRLPDPHVH